MHSFLKNPISQWLKWLFMKHWLEFINRSQHLRIHYMARLSGCKFGRHNTIYEGAVLNQVSLGDYSYVASNSQLARVSVGKFSCIGPDVVAGLGKHPTADFVSIHPIFYSERKQSGVTFADKSYFEEYGNISVGHDVWIGARSIILDGVTIGNGAIVAAGAVVVADVPPYAIVGGSPAKLIKYRFNAEEIQRLKSSTWWDKDDDWLRKHFKEFHEIDRMINLLNKLD